MYNLFLYVRLDFRSELSSFHNDVITCHALEKLVLPVSFARPVVVWFLFTLPMSPIVFVQLYLPVNHFLL